MAVGSPDPCVVGHPKWCCWTRSPRPAQLAFLGTMFMLLTAIAQPILTQVVLSNFRSNSSVQIGQMISIIAFVANIIRATGFGFLIGAAFIHRAQQDPRGAFPFFGADNDFATLQIVPALLDRPLPIVTYRLFLPNIRVSASR